MAIKTTWICDVCGKEIESLGPTVNVNETEIRSWYHVTLNVRMINDLSSTTKNEFKYGYACSEECYTKLIDNMKKLKAEL